MTMFGINTDSELFEVISEHTAKIAERVGFKATISRQRVIDAFTAWKQDMKRSGDFNFGDLENVEPDHVKCAAQLSYWVRRMSPIVELKTSLASISDPPYSEKDAHLSMYDPQAMLMLETGNAAVPQVLDDVVISHRRRLMAYPNEYIALDLGFRMARTYELEKLSAIDNGFGPDVEFIDTFCYFLKFKNVSPHAIFMVYKALLFGRFQRGPLANTQT